jgi:hypothetical protein
MRFLEKQGKTDPNRIDLPDSRLFEELFQIFVKEFYRSIHSLGK